MRRSNYAGWALAAALTIAALSAFAQQNDGPILLPKPKPVPRPASPTLLVICDMACNWKLDGKARGRIAAGESAIANVVTGQHLVIAATEDGADQVKQLVKAEEKGQTVVSIELQPVREARLKAEQEARDKTAQEARDKAAREARDKAEQEARDKEHERIMREAAVPTWTDPATGLIWTKKDNGSDVNWQEAMDYCRNLQLAGFSGWRLPTLDELQGIYDPNANAGGWHVKGNLQLSDGEQWSSSHDTVVKPTAAWGIGFLDGRHLIGAGNGYRLRALCVRRSGE